MIFPLAVGTIAALAIVVIFLGVSRYIEAQTNPDHRIYVELARRQGYTLEIEEKRPSPIVKLLNRAIADRDFAEGIAKQLAQANLQFTVTEYLLIRTAIVLVVFLAGLLLTHHPIPGVILGGISFFIPRFYINRRIQKRLQAFNDQLEDVLTLLVGSLRAGYSLLQALNVVVEEIPSPASDEFKRVIHEIGLGLSLEEALENLVRRVESADLDMVVTAIGIQQDVGGNLADILDTITETIRERVRILGEIRVLTAQQRITGFVLACLPFGLGTLIYFLNPEYILDLFVPGPLLIIPGGALFMEFIGFLVIRKIVDIKV